MRDLKKKDKVDENLSTPISMESKTEILNKIISGLNELITTEPMKDQIILWHSIAFHLNMLAFPLPMRIHPIDDRKGYSDEWLIENGFESTALLTPGEYVFPYVRDPRADK